MDQLPCGACGYPADAASEPREQDLPQGIALPIASEELLQGRSCVMIRHGDALYALRATRTGKLILTK